MCSTTFWEGFWLPPMRCVVARPCHALGAVARIESCLCALQHTVVVLPLPAWHLECPADRCLPSFSGKKAHQTATARACGCQPQQLEQL